MDISVGAYVQMGQDLVNIVDSTPIKVNFKVPEKNVHDIGVGQIIEIRIDAFKDQVFRGTVEAVDAQIESESHSISLRGSIPNDDLLLRPGLFANISLIIGEKGVPSKLMSQLLIVKAKLNFYGLLKRQSNASSFLTGIRENGRIEIIAGIRAGQIVVTAGQLKLSDGVRVQSN